MPTATARKHGGAISLMDVNFDNDDSIISFVKDRWTRRDTHRQQIEKQWYTNVVQYLGYQYHVYDDTNGRFRLDEAPSWRVRLVTNRLMGIAKKFVSKALRQQPQWVSIPATGEAEDQQISIVANKVLSYYWRYLDMDRLVMDALYWTAVTGNSFMSVVWDPDQGPEIALGEEDFNELPEEIRDPRLLAIMKQGVRLGDLRVETHSPFQIDPDPEALRLKEANFLLDTRVRGKTYLSDRYGKKAQGLTPDSDDDVNLSRFYERRIQVLAGPLAASSGLKDTDQASCILTHSLWVASSKKHKRGYYCIVAGDKVLEKQDEIPNPFRKIPFIHLVETVVPGRFWATCSLEQCIPLQAELNRSHSQLVENRNLMARPKWLCPKGAGVLNTALTNKPGEVVEHNPGLPPVAWTPPALPEYVHRIIEYILRGIEDVSQVHEVTQARAPSGVRSGVAIAQLQEQDDQVQAPTFLVNSKELSKLGAWLLELAAENITEDRMMKLVGKDREIESFLFSGKNLFGPNKGRPGVNYFDVETQLGSQLPLSSAARKQFTVDLVNAGILDRVQDRKKIFRMLEIGTDEGVINEDQLDKQAANRENVQMMEGVDYEINPWDNDLIHLEAHTLFQKQPEFSKTATPEIIQAFERHKAKHQLRYQALTQPPPPEPTGGGVPSPTGAPLPEVPPEPLSEEEAMAQLGEEGVNIPPEFVGSLPLEG